MLLQVGSLAGGKGPGLGAGAIGGTELLAGAGGADDEVAGGAWGDEAELELDDEFADATGGDAEGRCYY